MKRPAVVVAVLISASLVVATSAPADLNTVASDPGGAVTDDPAGEHDGIGVGGAGYSTVEPLLGGQPDATSAGRRSRNVALVGALEAQRSGAASLNGQGDLLIVNITNPANPVLAGEWGVLDHPGFGVPFFYLGARQGSDARTYLHSVRANADGTRAYRSNWDAGVITLDISAPGAPAFLGRTSFEPGEEGNAHSVDEGKGGSLLAQADEDYTPFHWSSAAAPSADAPGDRGGVHPAGRRSAQP